jgi:hypothetical protein
MALPYAHYAYSRADVWHLAQGVFPPLIGSIALLATKPAIVKWPLFLTLFTASLWVAHIYHPGWQCRPSKHCAVTQISGHLLEVTPETASEVSLLRKLAEEYAPNGRKFVVAPFWPGAYALLERQSPMWEVYPLFPRSRQSQVAEIQRIRMADPGFILILDFPLDGRDDRRFRHTHPEISSFVEKQFQRLHGETDSPSILLFTN